MRESRVHEAVCLDACVNGLIGNVNGNYVDATFGRGGHSSAILSKLGANGRLYAFDRDPEAAIVAHALVNKDVRLKFFGEKFTEIPQELEKEDMLGQIDGIIFDLGVSSPQLDTADRGFSFRLSGPLDMRMDPSHGRPVAFWLAEAKEAELYQIIKELGEEKFARRIAKAIVARRIVAPITTTVDLAEIVSEAVPVHEVGKHPATRTFQALRMHINEELPQLHLALTQALDVLSIGGKLVVLSYHSLEHKAVKQLFKKFGPGNQSPDDLKLLGSKLVRLKRASKTLRPSHAEISQNRRARSACLRIFEKVA